MDEQHHDVETAAGVFKDLVAHFSRKTEER
jgi:hypothetical protein